MSNQTHDSYLNPFDDDQQRFLVLLNSQGHYSLWPTFAPIPGGWQQTFGPDSHQACLDHIEQHWTAINPFADSTAGPTHPATTH